MLCQEMVQLELLRTGSDQTPFPPLATALRMYGAGMPQWEPPFGDPSAREPISMLL